MGRTRVHPLLSNRRGRRLASGYFDDVTIAAELTAGPRRVLRLLSAHRRTEMPGVAELRHRFCRQLTVEVHRQRHSELAEFLAAAGARKRADRTSFSAELTVALIEHATLTLNRTLSERLRHDRTVDVAVAQAMARDAYDAHAAEFVISYVASPELLARWLRSTLGAHRYHRLIRQYPDAPDRLQPESLLGAVSAAYRDFVDVRNDRVGYQALAERLRAALRVRFLEQLSASLNVTPAQLAQQLGSVPVS